MSVKATGTGPSTLRTYTFPDYDAKLVTSVAAILPYVIGDLLYASSTTSLAKLADVAVGQVLVSGGVGVAPAWSASPALTGLTLVTPLNAASGGSGQSSYAVGDLLYASGAAALSKLADVAVGQVLASGGVGVAPAWSAAPTVTSVAASSFLSVAANPASAGALRLANLGLIYARNAANSGDIFIGCVDASNKIQIGDAGNAGFIINPGTGNIQWNKTFAGLGGGAPPTLGTIGGTGPTVAAQNSWLPMLDSTGAACWVPVWK